MHNFIVVPASSSTIMRYAAHLARTKCYSTVAQYLNIIRIIHMEFGLPNPMQDNWHVSSVLKGIKRAKGLNTSSKKPLLPSHLLFIRSKLNLGNISHKQFWAAVLCGFFGMLRVSNVCGNYAVVRNDMKVTPKGIVLTVRRSKTIQHGGRTHHVVLPFMQGHDLCPVTAILQFLASAPAPVDAPLFSVISCNGSLNSLTPARFRSHLKSICNLHPDLSQCSTHSLRKGFATWLLMCKIPLTTIKILGDWSSDAVFQYLLPDSDARFAILKSATVPIMK